MRTATVFTLLALLLAAGSPALAQAMPPLVLGAQLRVSYDCGLRTLYTGGTEARCRRSRGTLESISADSLCLARDEGRSSLADPLRSVQSIEVRREQVGPRVTGGRVAAQFVVGGVSALAVSLAAGFLGSRSSNCCGDDPGLVGAVIGLIGGATLAPAIPVTLIGDAGPTRGSFGAALLGSILGMGTFLLIQPAAGLDADYAPFWIGFYGLPTAGAVLGYYLSAQPRWLTVPVGQLQLSAGPAWQSGVGPAVGVAIRF